jgi:hypothetical protein
MPYESLINIFDEAYLQASNGKGKERHASGEPFDKQVICEIARRLGPDPLSQSVGPLYQAVKKIYESQRLSGEAGVRELLGALNYIAAAIIIRRKDELNS